MWEDCTLLPHDVRHLEEISPLPGDPWLFQQFLEEVGGE